MFRTLKIATLNTLALAVLCAMLLLVGLIGLDGLGNSNASLRTVYLDRVVPLSQLRTIGDDYAVSVIDAVNKANGGLISAEEAHAQVSEANARIHRTWEAYMATALTPEEARLAAEAEQLFAVADADIARLMGTLGGMQGDVRGQLEAFDGPLYASIDAISGAISALISLQIEVSRQEYETAAAAYPRLQAKVVGALVLALGLAVATGWLLRRKVVLPLQQARALAESLARGDLTARLHEAQQDEVGDTLRAMQQMQVSITAMVEDVQRAVAAAAEGDFTQRIDLARHRGFACDIAGELNRLAGTTATGLGDVDRVVGALARGDLSQTIDADYPGLFGATARAVNQTVHSLTRVIGEIEQAVAAAAERGDFSTRLELISKQGFNRRLAEQLNRLAEVADAGLRDVMRVTRALADGDLSQTITVQRPGLFGETGDALNTTVQQLRQIIGGIRDAADAMRTAASEIASGNTDLSSRTEQQAAALEETASSMEELTSAVRQNTDHARQARTLAADAAAAAGRGGEVVGNVVHTMREITEASQRIGEIIGVIDGIAFQTNILALNAAVEAARAGEQGRGFAVVASEVRALAQRSGDAAKEIRGLIASSSAKVDRGAQLVNDAGNTIQELVVSVRQVAELMAEVTAASDEQASGIEQVNRTVMSLDQNTQQNAALVEEAMAAARSMEEQAEGLTREVSRFREGAAAAGPRMRRAA